MPIPLGVLAVAGAGGGGGVAAFDLLQTVTPSGTGTVTFSGLDTYTSYRHLQLRIAARSSNAQGGIGSIFLRFNSSTTGYAFHNLFGSGSTVSSDANSSQAEITLPAIINDGATASVFSVGIIDILDFSSSNKNTTIRGLIGGTTTSPQVRLLSGLWNNTAAVTSFTLVVGGGSNYLSGSRISLYGIK
jgi:hypothetical protein